MSTRNSVRRFAGTRPLAIALLCLFLTGCGKSVSFESWQESVERYVLEQGGADPTMLRDVEVGMPGSALHGAGLLGEPDPSNGRDVFGVLLGHRVVASRPLLVYLAGSVSKEKVEDIRLAAVEFTAPDPTWFMSEPNDAALEKYLGPRLVHWRSIAGEGKREPDRLRVFPGTDDAFRLLVDGNVLTVEHVQSGARWSMAIASAGR